MTFQILPSRISGAAENMATDFMMLERYPSSSALRFRHYDWHRPAFTFGYSQKIATVREQLPKEDPVELCRRATGGGLVDHRHDWTYALVIPRGHFAYDQRALISYRQVHACIAEVMHAMGHPAKLKEHCEPEGASNCATGICFNRAELYDVIDPETGHKIAGAAQKRTKHGLLFQGSISREAVGATLNWEAFHDRFVECLAQSTHSTAEHVGWPDWSQDELEGLIEQYSSPEWIDFR